MDGENRHTLPKKERLCGKKLISELLAKGKHGSVPGLRYLCLRRTDSEVSRIMVSVPKKSFKRAVKRNLLKRRVRESWRKQKHALAVEGKLDILFMYSTKEVLAYSDIYAAVGQIIDNLNARYGSKTPADISADSSEAVMSSESSVSSEAVVSSESAISSESAMLSGTAISSESSVSSESAVSSEAVVSSESAISSESAMLPGTAISSESAVSSEDVMFAESVMSGEGEVSEVVVVPDESEVSAETAVSDGPGISSDGNDGCNAAE